MEYYNDGFINHKQWHYFKKSDPMTMKKKYGQDFTDMILNMIPEPCHDWFKFQVDGKYLLVTAHNPLDYWDDMEQKRINKRIAEIEQELSECGRPKPQFLCSDDDDDYQDSLELGWHINELTDELNQLRNKQKQSI